jgi:hypothetical protein
MTIFTFAAVVIVIAWFAVTALSLASFEEDEQVHPNYRSWVDGNPMCQGEPLPKHAEIMNGNTHYFKCNVAGDRPKRPLYVKSGRTFCARCEKPVDVCPLCGALRDAGVKILCECENGAHVA